MVDNNQNNNIDSHIDSHIDWHDAVQQSGYEAQFVAFKSYFVDYVRWFGRKSNFARYIMKLGIFVALYGGFLYCLNDFSFNFPTPYRPQANPWLVKGCLILVPLIIVAVMFFSDQDARKERWQASKRQVTLITLVTLLMLIGPLLLLLASGHWATAIAPLLLVGFGTAICAYLINRLEGYTLAWSRNRTALFKIQLNHAEKCAGRLNESQAQRRLLQIVEAEVDDRHRDIITDFHFFGERLTSLLKK